MLMTDGAAAVISLCIATLSLCVASYQDIRTQSVANYVWWIFSAGLLMLPFCKTEITFSDMAECLAVIYIQEHIMCRAYGRADSHAFSCCAVFYAFSGAGLEGHILHMSLSLVILSAVQALRGNIGKGLKLKVPVPFIPYIAQAFALTLILLKICGHSAPE